MERDVIESIKNHLYFISINKNNKETRYTCFEKYLENIQFDDMLYRVILEHTSENRDIFNHNGSENLITNKLRFLLCYIIDKTTPITSEKIKADANSFIWKFCNYYFKLVYHPRKNTLDYYIYSNKFKRIFKI